MRVQSTKPFFTSEMGIRDLAVKLLMRHAVKTAMMMLKKLHNARLLRNFSENQESDPIIVSHFINAGDFAVDVGANIGVGN